MGKKHEAGDRFELAFERAVTLARLRLRAEGKSFVVKDGVNPMVAAVEPVVTALNAPACEGLEAALRGLGAEVADMDREALRAKTAAWREEILRGDVIGVAATALLGKKHEAGDRFELAFERAARRIAREEVRKLVEREMMRFQAAVVRAVRKAAKGGAA